MRRSKGFTLIEIVIVVGIIGLLMIVLVPSITSSWNTNVMKGARLQAERVAKSIRMGILSGDIQTSADYKIYISENGPLNKSKNLVYDIEGIETLYENPKYNEELKVPSTDGTGETARWLRAAYVSDKIQIWNAIGTEMLYQEP